MNVSELAHKTGLSSYRLRHYEKIGLLKAARTAAGYRVFEASAVRDVMFIAKCREVGVSLKEIAKVLPAYRVGTLTFDDMIELMSAQIDLVDKQINELQALRAELDAALAWFHRKKHQQHERRSKVCRVSRK